MNYAAAFLPAVLCPVACAAAPAIPENDSHQKIAESLVKLLSDTEAVLNTCQDEASVQAAIPQLRALSQEAAAIAARQATIAPPIIQDDIAAAQFADEFAMLWQAICRHVDRLSKAGLYSEQMRNILRIKPTVAPMPPSDK